VYYYIVTCCNVVLHCITLPQVINPLAVQQQQQ